MQRKTSFTNHPPDNMAVSCLMSFPMQFYLVHIRHVLHFAYQARRNQFNSRFDMKKIILQLFTSLSFTCTKCLIEVTFYSLWCGFFSLQVHSYAIWTLSSNYSRLFDLKAYFSVPNNPGELILVSTRIKALENKAKASEKNEWHRAIKFECAVQSTLCGIQSITSGSLTHELPFTLAAAAAAVVLEHKFLCEFNLI